MLNSEVRTYYLPADELDYYRRLRPSLNDQNFKPSLKVSPERTDLFHRIDRVKTEATTPEQNG